MTTPSRFLTTVVSLGALSASWLFLAGCKPKPQPEVQPRPFTAKLTEIPGVQAIYTLRHPKLILDDLDKLMAAVPETSLLRMFMGKLAPYGYPEFSELAPDANIGIALLKPEPSKPPAAGPVFVAFAKLKPNGKIWTALQQHGMALETHGEWTWIAKEAAAFANVTTPGAITAYVSRPQTEELRAWGRVDPALLAKAREKFGPWLDGKLAARPEEERKAARAYVDVIWGYLAQLHSAGGSLDLNDTGITMSYEAQFEPGSAIGTWLRYAPGEAPKLAASIPDDDLASVVVRQNIPGQIKFIGSVFDSLIAVDCPKVSGLLASAKASYQKFSQQSDGGVVMTFNMDMPRPGVNPTIDFFCVYSGKFSSDSVAAYYRDTRALTEDATNEFFRGLASVNPNAPVSHYSSRIIENALTVDGVPFNALETSVTPALPGKQHTVTMNQYYGVANGNVVAASNESSLRAKLPAVLAGRPVANGIPTSLTGDQVAVVTVRGSAIVDMVVKAVKPDLADAGIQAQIKTLKEGYAAAAPVTIAVSASQARGILTYTIPYKFIEQSVRLGQFSQANKPK